MSVTYRTPAHAVTAAGIISALSPLREAASPEGAARAVALQIAELIEKLNNPNSMLERDAIDAALNGRAAFWRNTSYSNAAATMFAYAANERGLAAALEEVVDRRQPPEWRHPGRKASALLATLIPLNVRAEIELRAAKAEAEWEDADGLAAVR